MTFARELMIAVSPWRGGESPNALRDGLLSAISASAVIEPSFEVGEQSLLVGRLGPRELLSAIDVVARGDRWAMVVCLKAPPLGPRTVARHVQAARRRPTGILVRPDHRDAAVREVDALLQLQTALLRRRSPATWKAIDAVRSHPTRTAAAQSLGYSVQAVSQHLRGGHLRATSGTLKVLEALLRLEEG